MAFGCVCASPRHTFCNLHGKITAEKRERARQTETGKEPPCLFPGG